MKSGVITLRSIELAGFKSFAKRTKVDFGSGLVAIVGPNGSGKSNIADAIRWVFGEQKNKSLRSDKSEDLIYHGGAGKAQASMAEVVLTLDNSSGKIPLELDEIEITRRLYRSGESNYLLNGRKVSLSSIREVLAKSGFGVGSYTVVGQGMIDRLVLADGLERKKLFEEASGIKQFEIKLGQTKKKLDTTKQNLNQINELIQELKPQLSTLEHQSSLLAKRQQMVSSLGSIKLAYIGQAQHQIKAQKTKIDYEINKVSQEISSITSKVSKLEASHHSSKNNSAMGQAEKISKELGSLEASAQVLDQDIAKLNLKIQENHTKDTENNQAITRTSQDIEQYKKNISDHNTAHKVLEASVSKYEAKLAVIDEKIKEQTKILDKAKKSLAKTQKTDYLLHSLGLIDILQDSISKGRPNEELSIIFYKLRRSIKHSINDNSAELALSVGKVQNIISRLLDEREKQVELQTVEIIKLRASEMDSAAILLKIKQLSQQLAVLQKTKTSLKSKNSNALIKQMSELEKLKQKLHLQIEGKRSELVGIAGQTQKDEGAEYFSKHEELISQRVSLEHHLQTHKLSLSELNHESLRISKLKKTWFPGGTSSITPINRKVDISEVESLTAQLSMLQEIDPEVQQGAQEAKERMGYLQSQQSDLQKALADLENLSEDTNKKMQITFKKGFDKINRNFSKSFVSLFGGGCAELTLKEHSEGYGIEIIVQLPNKKLQPISSLSGGEKALASVALLSAILSSNPSPFVVLDEVDAALDEQNTKKFAKVISDITKHSQVLVITHNHETMSSASELLGVTTSGNNDSHIIRVRLDNLATVSPR